MSSQISILYDLSRIAHLAKAIKRRRIFFVSLTEEDGAKQCHATSQMLIVAALTIAGPKANVIRSIRNHRS